MHASITWLDSLLEQQKHADLTAGHVTASPRSVTPERDTVVTPQLDTLLTPPRTTGVKAKAQGTTPKRKYKPRARHCKCCNTLFTPKSQRTAKYCSDNCRQRGNRAKAAKLRKSSTQPVALQLDLCTCAWCTNTWFADPTKRPKYCTPACKTAAYRQRRITAIETLVALKDYPLERAEQMIWQTGMKRASRYLSRSGYHYDELLKCWIL